MFASLWGAPSGQDVVYPELPTPQTKEEYIQLAKDKFKVTLEEEVPKELSPLTFVDKGDRGWNDIKLYDRPIDPAEPNRQGVKVVGTVPGSPKVLHHTRLSRITYSK